MEKELSAEIKKFLVSHAATMPDDPGEYTSPDAYEFLAFANALDAGIKPVRIPFSYWGSGGYRPYTDDRAKSWHDDLLKKCKAVCNS